MIGRVAAYGAAVVIGLAGGLASALGMAGLWPGSGTLGFGDVAVGGWRSDFAIGSQAADPYTRARIARHGLLALAQSEAVYFTITQDNTGEPLRESCSYRLSGGAMPAGWWSVTLYDKSSMLPANTDGALSIDASRAGQGNWQALIAPQQPASPSHWISSRNAGTFDLTLRLYLPEARLLAAPEQTLAPPRITRLTCGADR